jgi:hypothetical protein
MSKKADVIAAMRVDAQAEQLTKRLPASDVFAPAPTPVAKVEEANEPIEPTEAVTVQSNPVVCSSARWRFLRPIVVNAPGGGFWRFAAGDIVSEESYGPAGIARIREHGAALEEEL